MTIPGEAFLSRRLGSDRGHARSGETPEAALPRESKKKLEANGPGVYHVFLVRGSAGPEPFVKNAEHVELGRFTPSEARELNLADPAYLELFARVDAPHRGRR